jgi:hypothetical protein
MAFSTFSSKTRRPARRNRTQRRQTIAAVAIFLAVLAACVIAGEVASRRFPTLLAWRGDQTIERPDPKRFALASLHTLLDHQLLYHGFDHAIDAVRKADVLLLGNSRMNLAFPDDVLRQVASEHGVTVYNLGLGFDERVAFSSALIERHDLRPKVVVVNADRRFFASDTSPLAARLMQSHELGSDAWQDWKERNEASVGWNFRLSFHRYIPRFNVAKRRIESADVYRSLETGSWWWALHHQPSPEHTVEVELISESLNDDERRNALEFKRAMDARGVAIVLTQIPQREMCNVKLRELVQLLGAPVVLPQLDGLKTADQSHLDAASAARFSSTFLSEFFERSAIRMALYGRDWRLLADQARNELEHNAQRQSHLHDLIEGR